MTMTPRQVDILKHSNRYTTGTLVRFLNFLYRYLPNALQESIFKIEKIIKDRENAI